MSGGTGPTYYGDPYGYAVPGPGYNPGGFNYAGYAGMAGSLVSAFSQWNQSNMIQDAARFSNEASLFESRLFSQYSRMSLLEAKAQQNLAEFNAEFNARSADIEAEGLKTKAESVKTKTVEAMTKLRKEGSKVTGAQTARYAKGNVIMEGTPALVVGETYADIEDDLAEILAAGRLEESSYRLAEAVARLQGQMTRKQGTMAGQLIGIQGQGRALNFDLQGMNALHQASWRNYAANFQSWTQRFGAMNTLLTGFSNWYMPNTGTKTPTASSVNLRF